MQPIVSMCQWITAYRAHQNVINGSRPGKPMRTKADRDGNTVT